MPLLRKKKKAETNDTVRLIETLKLFEDEKEVKDVGFYENTSAASELKRQRLFRAENSDYLGLFGSEGIKADELVPSKSVAKTYGTKYVSDGKHQLASSIVVDVRSYKKEEEEKPKGVKATDIWGEEKPATRRSFFDDLLKELDQEEKGEVNEDENTEDQIEEEKEEIIIPPKKVEIKKKEVNKPVKKKRAIDIDIISGDFGGSDIL